MPDELAAEKGAGSDAVSTLSNYLAIRGLDVENVRSPEHVNARIAKRLWNKSRFEECGPDASLTPS
jgi:hypothetical protein